MKLCFAYRFQHLQNTLLYDTVNDCGNTQRSCFSVRFWDFYPPYRAGIIPTELFLDKSDELLLLHAKLVAQVLGVSISTAYEVMHEPGFPTLRVGSRMVVPKEKFIRWVEEQSGGAK